VGQRVQVFWWNEPLAGSAAAGDEAGRSARYGKWFGGRVNKVDTTTGTLEIKYDDGDRGGVSLGVSFVHFGAEPPAEGQRARLPPPLTLPEVGPQPGSSPAAAATAAAAATSRERSSAGGAAAAAGGAPKQPKVK
ncbi:hypothetical protein Agub_g6080, partial [Astrephomene gubernaculifera]